MGHGSSPEPHLECPRINQALSRFMAPLQTPILGLLMGVRKPLSFARFPMSATYAKFE
jgi:hypothetical protein